MSSLPISPSTPKFKVPAKNSIRRELKKRANEYFKSAGTAPTGNRKLFLKALFIVSAYFALYIHLVFFTPHWAIAIVECIILGMLTAAVGFNIMHDGAHGSFSSKKWVNELAGMSLNLLGANVFMWKTKHNTVHHTYTNIEGVDDDLNARPFLRLCENQKRYAPHKYQHIYFGFVYALLYHYWVFFTDYKKYFTGRVGEIEIPKMSATEHFLFWFFKIFHLFTFIVFPIYMVGFLPWLIGFTLFGFVAGIVMSLVFQLAHVVEETSFPAVDDQGMAEDEWVIHQLRTTANFSPTSRFLSWFTGGLNYQIEHHLFPNISHIHYPAISKIVQQLCLENGIPYIQYHHFGTAVRSHVNHLRHLGAKS